MCAFSKKQNAEIHWAMLALELKDLPSDRVMDDIDKYPKKMCGVQSIRYSGKLGHVYYVNDLAALIAQVGQYTKPSLSQAWQAKCWLNELDSDLTTPMIRIHKQDFFINKPTLLSNGIVCMPVRWFTRGKKTFARVWKMRWASETLRGHGWIIEGDHEFDVEASDFLVSFPVLSAGHRVLAFPIWLYCDDTSGNTSKKWNKHNSFLFAAAGIPRQYVHQESNIHFLATSNIAPPLEMLDGIVDQLTYGSYSKDCQNRGIWAGDSHYQELVLVIPSVLAMLGDNPMQSEFACHIGFKGRLFCQVCWVKGVPEQVDDEDEDEDEDEGNETDGSGSDQSSISSGPPGRKLTDKGKKKHTKKKDELVLDMVSRIGQFMLSARLRSATETQKELRSQFKTAREVGGQAGFKRRKTESGIKDTFQGAFLDRIFAISSKKGRKKVQKQADIAALLCTFPDDITSPVWHLNPHQDTPVEILHVILLGFVKYFSRDAVARVNKSDQDILIARLSSFNDFRTIIQVAPFVLQGLLPAEYIELWTSLSAVVTLVWQPHINDLDKHIVQLEAAIKHFLNCTCHLTLEWFNKPKFHVILHLPTHIRRFGPAMLFATEGFESFNVIIRSCSVHSNQHAPSHDIASRMAKGNHIRHLLSRGFFPANRDFQTPSAGYPSKSLWMDIQPQNLENCHWPGTGAASGIGQLGHPRMFHYDLNYSFSDSK
ncbi:hypothetical protein B0H10DRAFT_2251960 [Mycena sp. CBHHK59/15]|nr:hypothetical protein B0H10DRAFT_2251960 [Mycena sp. CBHHK59/15]